MGVAEAGLILALTAGGITKGDATAAVFVQRLFSALPPAPRRLAHPHLDALPTALSPGFAAAGSGCARWFSVEIHVRTKNSPLIASQPASGQRLRWRPGRVYSPLAIIPLRVAS